MNAKKQRIFIFVSVFCLLILILIDCQKLEINNICDPRSDAFKEVQVSKIIAKDISPVCSKDYISTIILYSISGSVTGLISSGLKLSLNGIVLLSVESGSKNFYFMNILTSGSSYSVKVFNQPAGFFCSVTNGDGFVKNSDVDAVSVICSPTCNPCNLFLTNSGYPPNPGSAKNFDTSCMADGNYPGTGNYKAMVVDGVTRSASTSANLGDGQIDWVFAPNRTYRQFEGVIGTTNSTGLFTSALSLRFSANSKYWTGLNGNWTTNTSNTCDLWRSNSGSFTGGMGQGNSTLIADITAGWTPDACNLYNQQLICVEQ
ncbi:Hypothetical protein LBF_1168 [Leptospira biflexa serovar Patoc strain 'Patoc 1 (Ames)']|uniref:DUF1554 domain-containing protein n=1 Tax=Leptospira biflexa serovar Patoc (strain Patoc 1 / ATCC 23582 / Paris) TaxID=456481 RepID=B0SNP6_LEPBP|nr:DUF1554 domain-containing protein [Leptospira biflexa]ABZ93691.1 Hypothetical protein LBF_1168 [Leptospira biflexa serovar Patoc strain 'Patoc 1 (Ames)']ABZ97327.1 Hypothetical protein LEPBI_I1213 [Leptospira biflexa serovar Patoc strain 'Patoc 1 (Paris)']